MKKRFHVLEEELEKIANPRFTIKEKFFGAALDFLGSDIQLNLKVKPYIYLKAKQICEDIQEEAGRRFNLAKLINILYDYFLVQVKKAHNEAALSTIYRQLMAHRVDQAKIYSYNSFFDKVGNNSEETAEYSLFMKRKLVLRGEIFIQDVSFHVNDVDLSIELILETLLSDFIKQWIAGEGENLLDQIIDELG